MWYVIMGKDAVNSLEKRLHARSAHLQRLEKLRDEGRLLTAGPLPAIDSPEPGQAGFSGSLIVAEFEDIKEAEEWANADPYIQAGVYQDVVIHPYLRVLP
ncbi:MAG: YciI family protein [Gammaproteobacteria bacterium]|nr:MAG: YciI family protein [Gammaproteobacteria bacterium]